MDRGEFSKVGNRKSYSFSLEMAQGRVSNNISGSAVARDLAGVLTGSSLVMQFLKAGTYKINMDKNQDETQQSAEIDAFWEQEKQINVNISMKL